MYVELFMRTNIEYESVAAAGIIIALRRLTRRAASRCLLDQAGINLRDTRFVNPKALGLIYNTNRPFTEEGCL